MRRRWLPVRRLALNRGVRPFNPNEDKMDDLETAAPGEAADESVMTATELTEAETGQEEGQPAEDEARQAETEEKKKSASQERRERRKAHEQRLAEEAENARRGEAEAQARLNRIKSAMQGESPPREGDFTDPIEFAAAKVLYQQRQTDARRQEAEVAEAVRAQSEQAQRFEAARIQERAAALDEQKAEARAVYADFDQVFAAAIIPPHVAQIVLESDQAADVAYHLGKNPAVARQIAAMNPVQAAREIGRIEAQVSLPKPKTQSAAPSPITPVRPGGTSRKDPGSMTPAEFAKWRDAGGTF